jgi:hypothetical protein
MRLEENFNLESCEDENASSHLDGLIDFGS